MAVVAALVLLATGCTGTADQAPPADDRPEGTAAVDGCGPPAFAQVRGRAPRYLGRTLDAFPNDHALCGGIWLPRAQADFTAQGPTAGAASAPATAGCRRSTCGRAGR
ncbi:MAG: hypothetical protein M3237_01265 [Actinomycetota bacterium]|nr:hypothetical protein [Actinomycetota bacterium]